MLYFGVFQSFSVHVCVTITEHNVYPDSLTMLFHLTIFQEILPFIFLT